MKTIKPTTMTGYFRHPTIHGDSIVYLCEDDLWQVSTSGGVARRLTAGLGGAAFPAYSPDGRWIAYSSKEEGHSEVYLLPAEGGALKRLTFLGVDSYVVGWTPEGKILFASNTAQHTVRLFRIFSVSPDGGEPALVPFGVAYSASFGPRGSVALGRNYFDPARWKRYRGGMSGEIWIRASAQAKFKKLSGITGNLARPLWLNGRVYFLSDHTGIANLFSCTTQGTDLVQHTFHKDFYVRFPATDGVRIVYQCGAEIFLLDPKDPTPRRVEIQHYSQRTHHQRKFVFGNGGLEHVHLSPDATSLLGTVRGKLSSLKNWDGAVSQHGTRDGVRYRNCAWLFDGKRFITCSDEGGEEVLEVRSREDETVVKRFPKIEIGRVHRIVPSPRDNNVAVVNNRHELILFDAARGTARTIETSTTHRIESLTWSQNGRYLAYCTSFSRVHSGIKIYDLRTRRSHVVTTPVLRDWEPAFDPEGRYLYFLSAREFEPVMDRLSHDYGFPKGVRVCLVTLRPDVLPPGMVRSSAEVKKTKKSAPKDWSIDFAGIEKRISLLPIPEGRYIRLEALKDKLLYLSWPIEGALWGGAEGGGSLEQFDLETQRSENYLSSVTACALSGDRSSLYYWSGGRLRVIKAGEKPDPKFDSEKPSRKSGWIDTSRIRLSLLPHAEWRQIFREAWGLQKEFFWDPTMSLKAWKEVYARYEPLLNRVGCRSELSDLIWEMQAELGTSHAYEGGGDYRSEPRFDIGLLGLDLKPRSRGYEISKVIAGDIWDERSSSPLARPGINIQPGDTIESINGIALTPRTVPGALLVHQVGQFVDLSIRPKAGKPRTVTVKTLGSEFPARYRDWVEGNRERTHELSKGKIGYIHVPDMMPRGLTEFYRYYLQEFDHKAVVIDVRFNGGGNVSHLLFSKIAQHRIGRTMPRWSAPSPYPPLAPGGPLGLLVNEYTASDGDIFSHSFRVLKLGPIVGKRTWGGVVGIWPRNMTVDGGTVTQPEYAHWFEDIEYGLENYGTEPDIEVEMTPEDYAGGKDPQLNRVVEVLMEKAGRSKSSEC